MDLILITGATGLLGSSLVPHLRKDGYRVVTHANNRSADFIVDLSNNGKTYEILEEIQPTIIINLVGITSVELCEQQVCLAYRINTSVVENIVHWIKKSKPECHLIQISTDQVYDGIGPHEESNITIKNNYASSKYSGEMVASQVSSTVLRTNFVGRSNVSYRESLTDWVYNELMANRDIQVLTDVLFSPLSITTLTEMIKLVIQKKPIGTYNLGSKNGMSKADFDFSFAAYLNLPTSKMTRIDTERANFLKAYRPKDMRMDSSKFEREFDIILPNLPELIREIAEEYKNAR